MISVSGIIAEKLEREFIPSCDVTAAGFQNIEERSEPAALSAKARPKPVVDCSRIEKPPAIAELCNHQTTSDDNPGSYVSNSAHVLSSH